jgi:hypothetical protein
LTPDALSVTAAIRLSPVDSIGVPVFMAGNSMYVPEMDADFNISSFMHFENEDGYELTSVIPDEYRQRLFRVGDPAPIIFWIEKASHIVEGDAEKAKLEEIFGIKARVHPVLKDLGGMLHDARTGFFKRQQDEWLAKEIEVTYGDVFLESPSRTKYWLHRYRVALENARKLTQPPHPIDVRLRRASTEWLQRFATKAELPMISALLGEASQGIYSVRQITEIMFAYLSNKLTTVRRLELAKIAADETIRSLFAHGMYEFYIKNGSPNVAFKYERLDFAEVMKIRLAQGDRAGSYEAALNMSKVLFGDRDAPRNVDDAAVLYIRPLVAAYQALQKEADTRSNFRGYRISQEELASSAPKVLSLYENIQELGCVMNGEDRKNGSMMPGRFGVDESQIQWCWDFVERDD